MKIGILTSSRADFGIYLPLLKKLKEENIDFEVIAFGTHLSFFHGYTLTDIENQNINVKHKIESLVLGDSEEAISGSIGLTIVKFSSFWAQHRLNFDLVFCLGDRFEMFAAVYAGVAFNIKFAHIHGGETTLGAIDNVFRHAITLASKYHFVATQQFADKVEQVTGSADNIYNVGALSLDNLSSLKLLSVDEFKDKWNIDLSKKTILTTFHPETVNITVNEYYINEIIWALKSLNNYQVLITMPNADTAGNIVRTALIESFQNADNVFLIENLGSQSYFTAMKYCSFLLGNTSSGIIEAASFNKNVINLGDRQNGRLCGDNILQTNIKCREILAAVKIIESKQSTEMKNVYYKAGAADSIINTIKNIMH